MAEGGDGSAQDIHQSSKKTKSEVWAYFGFLKNAEGQLIEDCYPVCRTCRKQVSAKGSNTSNLMAHLRDHHPRLYSQCKDRPRRTADVPSCLFN
ncbi:E3 SUMO-protein ligase ZBED1-like [Nothobranchius furzeri]|uniref:E3 SUMO-protein ligase ZBED1-like n=1 Tax=Nothobranchius furzeri TaxID=105023 RepID=UPI003904B7A3